MIYSFNVGGREIRIGTEICYEEYFFDNLFNSLSQKKVDLIVILANQKEVGRGIWLASQFAKQRAAIENVPIIRAANTGISQIIDSKGRVLSQTPAFEEGILVEKIKI